MAESESDFRITTDTQHLARKDGLWGVYCEERCIQSQIAVKIMNEKSIKVIKTLWSETVLSTQLYNIQHVMA